MVKIGICLGAAYLGMQVPCLFLKNRIAQAPALDQARLSGRARPAADLRRIRHVDRSGVQARSAAEIGSQSIPLAEELTLTTAELSYLQDRRQAYENLAKRTDLDGVKSVCMALQQAERYGTPLAQTLRVMAQENRDMRMSEAEKKAAGLPPKLTVPMILFFLPVLFVVILGPGAIRVMADERDELSNVAGRAPVDEAARQRSARSAAVGLDRRRAGAALFQPFCCASICRR